MKRNRNHALRNQRRKLAKRLSQGQAELRVTGSEKNGFCLGGEVGGQFVLFGQSFDKQKDAVASGEQAFGQKAKKILQRQAA